jgi:uncharacterized protein YecT (DUF1311 family)
MHRRIAACALALAATTIAHAAEPHFCNRPAPHPIDAALAQASERSGGVTVDLANAQTAAWAAWDKELNRVYAALLKKAPSPDALRAAQRAWLAYDKAQAQWDATLYADQGTSAALNQGGASLARRRARVCDLQNDLEGL